MSGVNKTGNAGIIARAELASAKRRAVSPQRELRLAAVESGHLDRGTLKGIIGLESRRPAPECSEDVIRAAQAKLHITGKPAEETTSILDETKKMISELPDRTLFKLIGDDTVDKDAALAALETLKQRAIVDEDILMEIASSSPNSSVRAAAAKSSLTPSDILLERVSGDACREVAMGAFENLIKRGNVAKNKIMDAAAKSCHQELKDAASRSQDTSTGCLYDLLDAERSIARNAYNSLNGRGSFDSEFDLLRYGAANRGYWEARERVTANLDPSYITNFKILASLLTDDNDLVAAGASIKLRHWKR
ncbi:MAG: hypothetical protein PHG97_03950 [Candidatus Margulisbacteria bacterium]|nr:hypothetical protein [Candidatus Margulisiibacteriota bacterium]